MTLNNIKIYIGFKNQYIILFLKTYLLPMSKYHFMEHIDQTFFDKINKTNKFH